MTIDVKKFDVLAIIKRHAVSVIIGSILMLAIAILLCIAPGYTSAVIIWITLGLMALFGLFGILKFIFPGKGNKRDPYSFIFSILMIALFVLLLICGLFFPPATIEGTSLTGFEHFSLQIIRFLSIFFGVVAIFNGVLCLFALANPENEHKGWTIFNLILNIGLGILMIIFPVILWAVGCYISAAYLIIMSIFCIVVASKAIHETNKAKKAGVNVTATVAEVKLDDDVIENKNGK